MNPKELISAASLFTLGGASFAVTLLGNVLQYIFHWNPRWLGLAVSLLLAGVGAAIARPAQWSEWIVALFQGLQIYATAVGITAVTGKTDPEPERDGPSRPATRVFWRQWF